MQTDVRLERVKVTCFFFCNSGFSVISQFKQPHLSQAPQGGDVKSKHGTCQMETPFGLKMCHLFCQI